EVAGVGPRARSSRVSSSGNGEVGSVILELCDRLVATIVPDNYNQTNLNLACTVMAGLLHFLIVASFVWMLLEATQLFMLVRKLTKVQVIKRDGLPKPVLYIVGYGVPLIVVGVSALVYSDGYGATGDACWLSTTRNFNWALTGPVVAILATRFAKLLTLINGVLFKIVAQFVILGCTWILGLYQSNLFFQVLFIILNSQQGTFLFIVHCVLNKEVSLIYTNSSSDPFVLLFVFTHSSHLKCLITYLNIRQIHV
uniref:G-protein coupled receptors family 2 profile 2 domain-containing protein n=1 Tax=Periophthalmus magnuspinnatus TaxID=409849 RepID=A0A3B3Z622_9GOBI